MKLHVENIGRVGSAEVCLDGITVVTGGNGSGKSTISKALYTSMMAASDLTGRAVIQKRRSIQRIVQEWRSRYDIRLSYTDMVKVPVSWRLSSVLMELGMNKQQFFNEVGHIIAEYGREEIDSSALEDLYEKYEDLQENGIAYYKNYVVQLLLDNMFQGQVNTLGLEDKGILCLDMGSEAMNLVVDHNKISEFVSGSGRSMLRPIYITTSDLSDLVGKRIRKTNGNSIQANTELQNWLIRELKYEQLTAEEYHILQEQREVLDHILETAIDGNIKPEQGRLVYYDNWSHENVELENLASGMRIFLIIKRLLDNGAFLRETVLIIDEPESNLHPEWQLMLAELLVLLYKQLGVLIYINSHSPYFVRAVEFYANEHQVLDQSSFYFMEKTKKGMYTCSDVTEKLGVIYDSMAEPFNRIM